MDDLVLDNEVSLPQPQARKRTMGEKMGAWLIAHNVAKNPIQANYVLLVLVIGAVAVGAVVLFMGDRKPVGPTAHEQALMNQMNHSK